MSAVANIVYTLSEETGISVDLCRIALAHTFNNADQAKTLLAKWQKNHASDSDAKHNYGRISSCYDTESKAAALVEIKTNNKNLLDSSEFDELVKHASFEFANFGELALAKATQEILEKQFNTKLTISSARLIKQNKFSLLTTYIHKQNVGALIETEVDNEKAYNDPLFRYFSFHCALHIAAFNPCALQASQIDEAFKQKLMSSIEEECMRAGKALALWPDIIRGKLNKWTEKNCLSTQIFIKSEKDTVDDIRKQISNKIGSEIRILNFVRLAL